MSKIIKADHLHYTGLKKGVGIKIDENTAGNGAFKAAEAGTLSEKDTIYNETKEMVTQLLDNARKKAETILLEAKLKSEALLEEAKADLENLEEKAYQDGWNKGREKAEEETKQMKQNAENLLKQAFAEREKIISDSEKDILNFIIDTLDKIYLQTINNKQEIVLEISRNLLGFVKDARGQVTLKTSARDFPFLEYHLDELKMILTSGNLIIRIDNKLSTGHCVVISENGILEVDLDENLEKVKAVLQDVIIDD